MRFDTVGTIISFLMVEILDDFTYRNKTICSPNARRENVVCVAVEFGKIVSVDVILKQRPFPRGSSVVHKRKQKKRNVRIV